MKTASSRLIVVGISICVIGVILQRVATDLVAFLYNSVPQPNGVIGFILSFVISIFQLGSGPFWRPSG